MSVNTSWHKYEKVSEQKRLWIINFVQCFEWIFLVNLLLANIKIMGC